MTTGHYLSSEGEEILNTHTHTHIVVVVVCLTVLIRTERNECCRSLLVNVHQDHLTVNSTNTIEQVHRRHSTRVQPTTMLLHNQ